MSRKTTPETRMEARIRNASPYAQELYRNPFFMRAVNKAADMKCLHAIQTGRLRVVVPTTLPHPYRYIPRMDLVDDPSSSKYLAIFEVPGMKTENMTLQIHNGHLIIKGERKSPYLKPSSDTDNKISAATDASSEEATQVKKEDLPQITTPVQELRFGAFHRAIPVPKGIKDSDVTASILDGMLTVTWPKAPTIESPKPAKTSGSSSPPMAMLTASTASQ